MLIGIVYFCFAVTSYDVHSRFLVKCCVGNFRLSLDYGFT